ncbi:hypothetical protein DESA109040_14085 [Deinococcus saxicola]|uniref:hypothetical protein n=1 Tax=Deinococcus saxicola TaxID=249406 RepID=UPI0039F0FB6D
MTKTVCKARNITRTWKVDLYGGWGDGPGASVFLGSHTITLSADHEGTLSAVIDEAQATLEEAVKLLEWAKREGHFKLLGEERTALPAPLELSTAPIGKARACVLHKIMGMTGLPKGQHYAISAAALGEPWPLGSLADLTEREAEVVWAHLCRLYPCAREVAAGLQGRHQTQAAA